MKYAYIILGELEADKVASALIANSKWFIFTPLPNGRYEIQAKCEAGLPPVRKGMGWTARSYAFTNCPPDAPNTRKHTDKCGRTGSATMLSCKLTCKCWCHKLPKGVKP